MMTIIEYSESEYKVHNGTYEELFKTIKNNSSEHTQWIDVDISERDTVVQLASHYNLHQLTLVDIFKTDYLPKFEAFEDYFFITAKMISLDDKLKTVIEHISFVVGKNYIITFQEIPGDVFDSVRNRIINSSGNVRKRKSDYLLIRLLDAIVDNYGHMLEHTRIQIETLVYNLLNNNGGFKFDLITEILQIKKHANKIRSYIVPLKDLIGRMTSETGNFFQKSSHAYLNNISDNILFQVNFFETLREMLKDLIDLHNSQMTNEMNHIMKTLTIISAIFIPLTFIAGWYGMNFKFMPELDSQWSYPILFLVMISLSVVMIVYMKRKKWW